MAAAPARARTVVDSVRELGLGVVVAAGLMTAGCSGDKGESESEGTTEMTSEGSATDSTSNDSQYQTAVSAYGGPSYTSSYTTLDSDWTTTAGTSATTSETTTETTASTETETTASTETASTSSTGATTEPETESGTGDTGTTTG